MPPFTFDFTLKQPNMNYVPEQKHTVARAVKGADNICPYPIPTVLNFRHSPLKKCSNLAVMPPSLG